MSASARSFNGTSDRLDTGLHLIKGATDSTSIYAWIKRTTGTLGSILGVLHQFVAENRLEFQAQFFNNSNVPELALDLWFSGSLGVRSIITQVGPTGLVDGNPFWYDQSFFVGFVNDVPNNRARFFWGLTAETVVEVDVADFTSVTTATAVTQQWTDPDVTLNIGATGREGQSNPIFPLAEDWFSGVIDTVGLEFDTALTLEQLKQRAHCGFTAEAYYWPIDGTDPEPGISTIHGTTVVDGICDSTFGDPPFEDPEEFPFLLTLDAAWRNIEYRYFGEPQSPENIDPRVMILDALTLLPIIEIESYIDLHYVKSWTELDRFDLKIGAQCFEGLRLKELGIVPSGYDFILQVLIQNVFDFAGIIEFTSIDIADGQDVYVLKGGGVDKILQDKLAIPPAGSETDSYDDIAENVMRALVEVNLVNPQATDVDALNEAQRTIDLLDQTPNLSAGAIVKVEARNQTVFEAVREAALQDGGLGFQILIVAGQFMFDVFQGVDRSAYVVFALDRDNLKNLSITYDKSNYDNWLVMAGAGEGALRALATATVTADQGIKRKERFQDARELATTTLLRERGLAILATEGDFVSITGDRMPVSYPQYKIDFELGDILTFSAPEYALSIPKRVVEVAVTISQGHPLEVRLALGKAKVRQSNMILRNSLQATSRS